MKTLEPKKSLAGQLCPACREGHFQLVQIEHAQEVPDDNPINIAGLWVNCCDHCGEVIFPGETVQFIESVVAEKTEQLTAQELKRIREALDVETQDEMSEILGLGAKSYHKWESGAQFATRSMSYYIRVMAKFPDAFEWLRARGWRRKPLPVRAVTAGDWKTMFPDLARRQRGGACSIPMESFNPTQHRPNPALGLTKAAFLTR